jgi:hypothetical protein
VHSGGNASCALDIVIVEIWGRKLDVSAIEAAVEVTAKVVQTKSAE